MSAVMAPVDRLAPRQVSAERVNQSHLVTIQGHKRLF